MTRPILVPEHPRNPVVERRLDVVERRSLTRPQTTSPVADSSGGVFRIPWSVDGTLSTGTSNVWPFFEGDAGTLVLFWATIPSSTAGSTVLEVRRNGVAVDTLTLTAGTGVQSLITLSEAYAAGDYYTVACTTAGAGAADLQTIARFTA